MAEVLGEAWVALGIDSLSFSCSIKDVQTHLVCGKEKLRSERDAATVRRWGSVNTLFPPYFRDIDAQGMARGTRRVTGAVGTGRTSIHPERSWLSRADCGASVAPAALMMVEVVIHQGDLQARLESYCETCG